MAEGTLTSVCTKLGGSQVSSAELFGQCIDQPGQQRGRDRYFDEAQRSF
jgi:hypothetical protein